MGLDINAIRFILAAQKQHGVNFSHSVTIGRQNMNVTARDLVEIQSDAGISISLNEAKRLIPCRDAFADDWFKYLGALNFDSLDFADYEGATILQDLNSSLPKSFERRFSVVLDGGSLEHVFNFPTAIRNCMKMVKPGGHFITITPANNWMGHGFYQFSPELYASLFGSKSGFKLIAMYLAEWKNSKHWFKVRSPQEVGRRVVLSNNKPVYLYVIAQRIATEDLPEFCPNQSDYISTWEKTRVGPEIGGGANLHHSLIARVLLHIRYRLQRWRIARNLWLNKGYNPEFFERVQLFSKQ